MKNRQPSKTPHIKSWPPKPPPPPEAPGWSGPGDFAPPPPLPPEGPTRDTSRKKHKRTHWSERQPSNTPYTKSSPRSKNKPARQFVLWGFAKHKWQSLDEPDRVGFTMIGFIIWFILWVLSGVFAEIYIVFMIPWIILTVIGMMVFIAVIKHLVKGVWNKYFPEYQEFKQEFKSKRKTNGEQMDSISDLFEGYEDEEQPPEFHSQFHPTGDIIRR